MTLPVVCTRDMKWVVQWRQHRGGSLAKLSSGGQADFMGNAFTAYNSHNSHNSLTFNSLHISLSRNLLGCISNTGMWQRKGHGDRLVRCLASISIDLCLEGQLVYVLVLACVCVRTHYRVSVRVWERHIIYKYLAVWWKFQIPLATVTILLVQRHNAGNKIVISAEKPGNENKCFLQTALLLIWKTNHRK